MYISGFAVSTVGFNFFRKIQFDYKCQRMSPKATHPYSLKIKECFDVNCVIRKMSPFADSDVLGKK